MNEKWWLHLRPTTWVIIVYVLVMLLAAVTSCVQDIQKQERAKAYLQHKDEIFAAHVAELKSLPTTEVVTQYGSKGFISRYWSESGLSRMYSLDEYKAAVRAPYGADVDLPVEGDHFIVPWHK